MSNLVEAGKSGELADGAMKHVPSPSGEILLARVGDKYYAADNRCPHLGGRLSNGKLEGTVVTCPLHSSQFDLKDGSVVRWLKGSGLMAKAGKALKPPKTLKVYLVQVKDGQVLIEV
ncbi:MAG TPA: Rieske 2Fe-2S domain-containing protein [Dehalococcoidia bacterium]|nr:Rieske 2Fe-2S domain-containing protein [Dehalococcoidia bacterium]